jgi:UDP-N-acetylmuramyl pentapeptide phosphotransferase/UDP-N-acetylglucosamine-1-phosphate transferase
LGDGGAYFLGFMLAELGILLIARNTEVSPLFPLALCAYPGVETVFSMYRRKWVRNHPVNHPDALHLHTLVYRRLVFSPGKYQSQDLKNQANARVAWYFWLPASGFGALAVIFQTDTAVLLGLMLAYLGLYLWLYRRLVKFWSPRWMRLRA